MLNTLLAIRCVKCWGQVMMREGLDGKELQCLNCGSNQLPPVPAPPVKRKRRYS